MIVKIFSRNILDETLPWCSTDYAISARYDSDFVICSSAESLSFTLRAFVELMEHGIVSWDVLEHKFIKMVGILIPSD